MIEPANGSPLGSEEVTLNGVTFRLRWNTLAELTADSLGVDVREMLSSLREHNVGQLASFFRMFSAMVRHQFYPAEGPSAERIATMVDDIKDEDERREAIKRICQAVGYVLVEKAKALAVRKKLREPAPTVKKDAEPPALQ
jgi:hypothetical protein